MRLKSVGIVVALVLLGCMSARRPAAGSPANPLLYPYNQATSISFNVADVTQAWTSWKAANITSANAGGGGRLRVMGGTDASSSVSEGMAYGILFASLFDDQATLDGLWLFTRDHLDPQGLMHWHIGNYGQLLGSGAATDADEDMALGMINACVKVQKGAWPASPGGLDYCAIGRNLIAAIAAHEVDRPGSAPAGGLPNNAGNELLPGDQWNLSQEYPQGIVNLSYFSPGYFTVFGKFTNNAAFWSGVNSRNYAITNLAQAQPGNCSKLVPNWNTYGGAPQRVAWQPEEYAWWSYDAARFAWRVAVDKAWYDTAASRETMNEIGGFFSSVGINNLQARYRLDGTSVDNYTSAFFVGNAAPAIWAAPSPAAVNCGAATGTLKTSPQQAYDKLRSLTDSSYYPGAWRIFGMLLMTGNFPNLYELANGVTPATATPTPPPATATPTPQPGTATPTATPRPPTATPTATPRPSVTPTPQPGGCRVTYAITNQWPGGFTADVQIANTGAAINGWTLAWAFGGDQRISNAWNATASQSGQQVAARNVDWNAAIAPGGTASLGFQATFSGANAKPAAFALNGAACAVTP